METLRALKHVLRHMDNLPVDSIHKPAALRLAIFFVAGNIVLINFPTTGVLFALQWQSLTIQKVEKYQISNLYVDCSSWVSVMDSIYYH